jgi:Rrf2 family protein
MTGEYAIRTMVHLSRAVPGEVVQIANISESWDIPETFLRKIVARLSRAGLVKSSRGVGGGIVLAKAADQITLLEIVEEIEGPLSLNKCLIEPQTCTRVTHCAVHSVWCEAQDVLRERLSSKSLAQLARTSETAPSPAVDH